VTIENLPPLSAFGVEIGQISHAFLIYEALLYAQRINELQAVQPLVSASVNTSSAQTTLETLLQAVLAARSRTPKAPGNRAC
jgi:hypothetical protein